MLEYIFFAERFRQQFIQWLESRSIEYEQSGSGEECLVLIDEDIDEDLEEQIEDQYDNILKLQASAIDEQDNQDTSIHLVAVQYTDIAGSVRQVRLTPELVNRAHEGMTPEELQELVQAVADGVLNPDDRPLCQK